MAWNEPGGNGKNQDPWGGGKNQGPPDLDKIISNFFKKLRGTLTTSGGGGGNWGGVGGGGPTAARIM